MPETPLFGELIPDGCTPKWVELSITPKGVYVLNLKADADPENRWTWSFTAAVQRAFEALEQDLYQHIDRPAALLTVSESPKFFSNGIDPDGRHAKKLGLPAPSDLDALENTLLTMPAFIRPLQLPIPTVAAVGGHAFGAGMMFALGHDYRLQASGRGFMCAIELEIGVGIPDPELELFRHAMPAPAFFQTVLGAKRWAAEDSLRSGLVVKTPEPGALISEALAFAEAQAKLSQGERQRKLFMHVKNRIKGQVQRQVMEHTFPKGGFGSGTSGELERQVRQRYPHLMKHIGEVIEEVPFMPPSPKSKL